MNFTADFGTMDSPAASAILSGSSYAVSGWAIGVVPVDAVNVYVDGTMIGTATLGMPRPDVAAAYPTIAQLNCGWQYLLNTQTLSKGPHTVSVHIVDASHNDVPLPPVSVTVS